MPIASKQESRTKPRRPVTTVKAAAVRVDNLLGDFSEQTGALFG